MTVVEDHGTRSLVQLLQLLRVARGRVVHDDYSIFPAYLAGDMAQGLQRQRRLPVGDDNDPEVQVTSGFARL
jgi:hypothetical protein